MYESNSNTEGRYPTNLFFDLSPKTHVNSPRYDAWSVVLLGQNSDIVWPIECQHLWWRAERRGSSQIGDRICQWWISTGFRFGRSQSGWSTVARRFWLIENAWTMSCKTSVLYNVHTDLIWLGVSPILVICLKTFDLWSIREEFFRAKNQDQVFIALTLFLIKSNVFVDLRLASKSHKIVADVTFWKQSQTICYVVTQIYCNTLMHTVRPLTLNSD